MNTDWTESNIWPETNDDSWPDVLNLDFDGDEFQINIRWPELGTIEFDEDTWPQPYDTDDEDDYHDDRFSFIWLQPYDTDYLGWTDHDYYDSHTIILKINELKNKLFYLYADYERQKYDPEISQTEAYLSKISKRINTIFNNNVQMRKFESLIRNNLYTDMLLKKLNRWFRHVCAILKNISKNIDISSAQQSFFNISKRVINNIQPKKISKEEIIVEKYKPSRVQYIIDNYGMDALDDY